MVSRKKRNGLPAFESSVGGCLLCQLRSRFFAPFSRRRHKNRKKHTEHNVMKTETQRVQTEHNFIKTETQTQREQTEHSVIKTDTERTDRT